MKPNVLFKSFVLIVVLLFSSAFTNLPAQQEPLQIPSSERTALIAVYNSTNGDNWKNNSRWKTPPLADDGFAMPGTEGNWYGVFVSDGHVVNVGFKDNNNSGFIPHEIKYLTEMTWFQIESGQLSGTIPPELWNLRKLKGINLCFNKLTGSIPPEIGNLINLETLWLNFNNLSGTIPKEIGNLTKMIGINLFGNSLTGTIPIELWNLTQLEYLALGLNNLTGNIPPEIGNLTNLKDLSLKFAYFSGPIPREIGELQNLTNLEIEFNNFTGNIPPELGNLTNLVIFNLDNNQFSGSIPSELGALTNLTEFTLGKNQLSGIIPLELGNLTKLTSLTLDQNQLTGNIPPGLGNLKNLVIFRLNNNQFSGSIPAELGALTNLTEFSLGKNQLSGIIPLELGNLTNLTSLTLDWNQLTGNIPPGLGNLKNLVIFRLNNNQFSGSIPVELGALTNLTEFSLGKNQLSGIIPLELGNLTELTSLTLDQNRLTGEIPTELMNLYKLTYLDIMYNALYSNSFNLKEWLNSVNPGWENTQTIAPSGISATPLNNSSIEVSWTPIIYTANTGGYKVLYSTNPGGPYTYDEDNTTVDKTISSLVVSGLQPAKTYYFVIQTWTNPHQNNRNKVESEYSEEISATTPSGAFITVTSPNGGEEWKLGSSQNITWQAVGVSGLLKITLWKNGVQIGIIANNIDPATGSYPWIAGNYIGGTAAPGTGYTVKIKETGAATTDTSNTSFTLSFLSVTSPNGGENWKMGSSQNITWQAVGVSGLLKITLWKDGVQTGVIADNIAPAAGSFLWTTGQCISGMAAPGAEYTIKIKEAGSLLADTSDATFTLSPGITITSPNGGEAWLIGSARNITWRSGGLSNLVKITLWKDGALKGTVATNVNPALGSYSWVVGNYIGGTAAPGVGYIVKIKEINTSVADDSDAAFQLAQ